MCRTGSARRRGTYLALRYDSLAAELGIAGFIRGNELYARCPFHDDRMPSFLVNINTGLWICHRGCGQGDFPHLIMQIQGTTYQDALGWMLQRERKVSTERIHADLQKQLQPEPAYIQFERGWLEHYQSLKADIMPQWFLDRGFTWETIQHWGMCYDPLDAVVIPVVWGDEIVGTVTRFAKLEPKYRNSPGLERSKLLFGQIYPAQSLIILVEGILDAIWCWQNGFSAYSLLGTALSAEQIDILRAGRFGEVVLGLDNDEAGREATAKITEQLTRAGWLLPQIKLIDWPEGAKDAQDCNPEQLKQAFDERKDVAIGIFTR